MDIDIRKHIMNNFKNDEDQSIKAAINASIKENDEVTLPGMGVFLELIWKDSNEGEKDNLVKKIKKNL